MIEEIKELLGMFDNVPNMALWVIAGIFLYKVIWIGSIFGLVRLTITRGFDCLAKSLGKKEMDFGSFCIRTGSTHADLVTQINRMKRTSRTYIHSQDVDCLRQAIDMYEKEYGKPTDTKRI